MAALLVLLTGTAADAAPGLCVTKPPVVSMAGMPNTGPPIDPPSKKGQWFLDLRTGDENVRPCEFYDNVYDPHQDPPIVAGGGWASCWAIEGYIMAVWYDTTNKIYAFDLDVCITNDMPGYGHWKDGSNQHEEYLHTYYQIGEEEEATMWSVKWTAEFADDGIIGNFPNVGWPYIAAQWPFDWPGSLESNIYANDCTTAHDGYEELAWYCWTPDPAGPSPQDGQYMVPTWDFGDIPPGMTACRTIRFYLYQPVDPSLHQLGWWLEEWHRYQYDVLLNRTTSLKISTYFDALYPDPCTPYPHEEEPWLPWRSSDCSVFFNIEKPRPPKIDDMIRWTTGEFEIFWSTVPGAIYGVESSTDPYDQNYDENMMIWVDEIVGIIGPGGIISWVDLNTPPAIGPEKYYRVFVEDVCGQRHYAADTVGGMSLQLGINRNMVSSPFEPYPDGGLGGGGVMGQASLDKIVDFQLTGHPVSPWASDQIWAWDPILQTYIGAWLNMVVGQWLDFYTNGPPLFGIQSDRGYWFTINNVQVDGVLFGRVSKTNRVLPCLMNRNMHGSCFPVMCLFNECNLVGSGFTGHPVSQWASDKVEFWDAVLQTYYGVWYRTGVGWMEWGSMVNPPARDFYPTEGFWITVNNAVFIWTYPVPPRPFSP
jgi:hypothetical protein